MLTCTTATVWYISHPTAKAAIEKYGSHLSVLVPFGKTMASAGSTGGVVAWCKSPHYSHALTGGKHQQQQTPVIVRLIPPVTRYSHLQHHSTLIVSIPDV
jgi:hypothetical protein